LLQVHTDGILLRENGFLAAVALILSRRMVT